MDTNFYLVSFTIEPDVYQFFALGLIEDKQSVSKSESQFDDGHDLRKLVKKGKEKGLTAYQVLKEAGYIASDFAFDAGREFA